jgi:hypothetical protein
LKVRSWQHSGFFVDNSAPNSLLKPEGMDVPVPEIDEEFLIHYIYMDDISLKTKYHFYFIVCVRNVGVK